MVVIFIILFLYYLSLLAILLFADLFKSYGNRKQVKNNTVQCSVGFFKMQLSLNLRYDISLTIWSIKSIGRSFPVMYLDGPDPLKFQGVTYKGWKINFLKNSLEPLKIKQKSVWKNIKKISSSSLKILCGPRRSFWCITRLKSEAIFRDSVLNLENMLGNIENFRIFILLHTPRAKFCTTVSSVHCKKLLMHS